MAVANSASFQANKADSKVSVDDEGKTFSVPKNYEPRSTDFHEVSNSHHIMRSPGFPMIEESPTPGRNPDFVKRLAESNQTPKLTPKNTHDLTHLKIAPEMKNGKIHSPMNLSPSTPRSVRSSRSNSDKREERPLLGSSQKIVIVPAGKNEGRPQIKVTVGSTSSSDSSVGKRTPPRKRTMSGGKKRPENHPWKAAVDRGVRMSPSLKSLKVSQMDGGKMRSNASWASFTFPDPNARPLSHVVSVRSLASIGMGSTDGKKLTIRRVPTSPTELLNIADPKT